MLNNLGFGRIDRPVKPATWIVLVAAAIVLVMSLTGTGGPWGKWIAAAIAVYAVLVLIKKFVSLQSGSIAEKS